MKPIQAALVPTDGYITSFVRNTVKGWWEIEVGLPVGWVYAENSKIGCEVLVENEVGMLIKIFPKVNGVVVDDLVAFVEVVIQTNEEIAKKEKEFTDRIQKMKDILEKEAIEFYTELDELKENRFKKNNSDFDKKLSKSTTKTTAEKPKTPRKPRAPRTSKTTAEKKKSGSVTEETETLESTKE